MKTTTNTDRLPTTYTLEPSGTPGVWGVWYHNGNWGGYNGQIHNAFSFEAACAEQRRRAEIFGWDVAGMRQGHAFGVPSWLGQEIAAAAIERRETSIPDFVDVRVIVISERGDRWATYMDTRDVTPESVGAMFGIPARFVTDRVVPRT
jgi:hypothetical protein